VIFSTTGHTKTSTDRVGVTGNNGRCVGHEAYSMMMMTQGCQIFSNIDGPVGGNVDCSPFNTDKFFELATFFLGKKKPARRGMMS